MKKLKELLALGLVLILGIVLLTGCGKTEDVDDEEEKETKKNTTTSQTDTSKKTDAELVEKTAEDFINALIDQDVEAAVELFDLKGLVVLMIMGQETYDDDVVSYDDEMWEMFEEGYAEITDKDLQEMGITKQAFKDEIGDELGLEESGDIEILRNKATKLYGDVFKVELKVEETDEYGDTETVDMVLIIKKGTGIIWIDGMM